MNKISHNGTAPYTFHYMRYLAPYSEEHATLVEAVQAWAWGEDEGYLSGKEVTDSTGAVVVTHEEFMNGIWGACDKGTIEGMLADPHWHEKVAAKIAREEQEHRERYEQHRREQEAQTRAWEAMARRIEKQIGRRVIFGVQRTKIDVGMEGIDPFPDSRQIEGRAYPYLLCEGNRVDLYPSMDEKEITDYLLAGVIRR